MELRDYFLHLVLFLMALKKAGVSDTSIGLI
jgi:hypothetical protein